MWRGGERVWSVEGGAGDVDRVYTWVEGGVGWCAVERVCRCRRGVYDDAQVML